MVEYRKTFLVKIKLLLLYFMKFCKDGLMLPKEYPVNYIVEEPD